MAEVLLPPRRAINALPTAISALSDDERFAAIFNQVPGTSLSVVDVEKRLFVTEVLTPGCSLAYGAGPFLGAVARVHALSALVAIVLMAMGLAAVVYRARGEHRLVEPAGALMVLAYVAGLLLVYAEGAD